MLYLKKNNAFGLIIIIVVNILLKKKTCENKKILCCKKKQYSLDEGEDVYIYWKGGSGDNRYLED